MTGNFDLPSIWATLISQISHNIILKFVEFFYIFIQKFIFKYKNVINKKWMEEKLQQQQQINIIREKLYEKIPIPSFLI